MSANTDPIFPGGIRNDPVDIVNATGTSFVDLVVAGTNGTRVDQLLITTDDTASNTVQFAFKKAGTDYPCGEVDVPAGSGTSGTATPVVNALITNGFAWIDARGSVFLAPNVTLRVRAKTAVTAAKNLNILAIGGDY